MAERDERNISKINGDISSRRFRFTPLQKSLSFAGNVVSATVYFGIRKIAATYASAFCLTQPLAFAIRRYGAHKVSLKSSHKDESDGYLQIMTLVGILSSIIPFLIPHTVCASFPLFLCLRFLSVSSLHAIPSESHLQGISISNNFTVVGIVVTDWASEREKVI